MRLKLELSGLLKSSFTIVLEKDCKGCLLGDDDHPVHQESVDHMHVAFSESNGDSLLFLEEIHPEMAYSVAS